MKKAEIRERFATIATLPDGEIRLDEAALLIAAELDDGFDVARYVTRLDNLASRFETAYDDSTPLGISISSLTDFIHKEEGFTGNVKNYYAPENSYLNRVIDTRHGIPITLALIHIAVGRRLELPVNGINFPGHFLVRYGTDKHLIVDPFTGRFLSEPDCATLLKQIAGPRAVVQPHYFEPSDNKAVLLRILDNLKKIFWQNRNWEHSMSCIERQLLLRPEQNEFNVQLGAVYEMQGKVQLAQHTYTTVLQISDDEQLKSLASKRLLALETTSPTIH
ncbi:MAG TPA: transglutaminase-like domain-containing protein [Pseudomonadales bacterium]|nr:transglutaminase-like domain-containing protein [Pseudomonadales bacterium]